MDAVELCTGGPIERVDGYFQNTHVVAQGSIARSENGKGKTALIDLSTNNARIEDVLGLFVHDKRAPISGAITLTAKVTIPPGKRRFLEKVVLKGQFQNRWRRIFQSSNSAERR